jgi:hypothetical protein
VMMSSQAMDAAQVATPDHAVRNLLHDLIGDEPYVITHGDYRDPYHRRIAAIEAAFDRMEQA